MVANTALITTKHVDFDSLHLAKHADEVAVVEPTTVQPKNNACARSNARSSCAARTRKSAQEVKISCFSGLPARTFETQEVENGTARSYESYRKPQEGARSCCLSTRIKFLILFVVFACVGGRSSAYSQR